MNTKEMLTAYAAENGVTMTFDESGACTLPLDDDRVMHLQFRESLGELDLLAILGTVPKELRGRVFERLLAANYYWEDTLGATLSWQTELQQVVLTYPIKTETTDEATLRGTIDRFADLQAAWAERLKSEIATAEAVKELDGVGEMSDLDDEDDEPYEPEMRFDA